jgi:RNA polymerase sigma factor (TIGR02999 family)
MSDELRERVTEFLARIEGGDKVDAEGLLPLLYDELRGLARAWFRRLPPGQTLQPTALVHEAFLKLSGSRDSGWESRAHFFAVAAKAMRQLLANHVERRRAAKRGGGWKRVTLSGLAGSETASEIDLVALHEALARLEGLSPRQSRVVELRFLAGLGEAEVAHLLDVSTRTVEREWRMARAFLECELSGDRLS